MNTALLIALAIERSIAGVRAIADAFSEESKARRAEKKAKKALQKAQKARAKAADKAARKRAGLDDEGGGSGAGHEARAEWDREQAKRK